MNCIKKYFLLIAILIVPFSSSSSQNDNRGTISQSTSMHIMDVKNNSVYKSIIDFDEKEISKILNLQNVDFLKKIDLNGKLFKEEVFFDKVVFKGNASFYKSIFDNALKFQTCTFNSVNFSYIETNGLLKFTGIDFNEFAQFRKTSILSAFEMNYSTIDKGIDFSSSYFSDYVHIKYSTFDSIADFSNDAHFESKVTFDSVIFNGNVDFSNVKFDSTVLFKNIIFIDSLNFSKAHFRSSLIFDSITLPYALVLSNTKVQNTIDLTLVKMNRNGKKCKIYLEDFDVDKLLLDYSKFKLSFLPATSIDKKYSIYKKLLNKFKKDEVTIYYNTLFIEFIDFKYGEYLPEKKPHWIPETLSVIEYLFIEIIMAVVDFSGSILSSIIGFLIVFFLLIFLFGLSCFYCKKDIMAYYCGDIENIDKRLDKIEDIDNCKENLSACKIHLILYASLILTLTNFFMFKPPVKRINCSANNKCFRVVYLILINTVYFVGKLLIFYFLYNSLVLDYLNN